MLNLKNKILLSVLVACCAVHAALEVDVTQGAKKFLPGAKVPVEQQMVELPDQSGRALEFSWDANASKYIEIVLNKTQELPRFSKAVVTAKFFLPDGCPVNRVGLRLTDSQGETFQYPKTVNAASSGYVELVWEIADVEWQQSWGGKETNHRLDHPVKVRGFGIDYKQGGGIAGMYLLSLSAAVSQTDGTVAIRQLNDFSWRSKFTAQWSKAILVQDRDKLSLSGIAGECGLTERKNSFSSYDTIPQAITLDAELQSGELKACWVFRDSANQTFKSPVVDLKSGRNATRFEMASPQAKPPVRLQYLLLSAPPQTPASVVLYSSTIETPSPLVEALDFDILTGNDLHILKTGEETALQFEFRNTASKAGEFHVAIDFLHFDGDKATENLSFKLNPGEAVTKTLDWMPKKFGYWDIAMTVQEKNHPGQSARKNRNFAYLKPAGPTPERTPGFLFGICTHSGRWGVYEQMLEAQAAALCGAKVIRDSIEWSNLQPARGVWNFEAMDFLVKLYQSYGIEHQALFAFTPRWAAPPEAQASKDWTDWNRSAPEMSAWREYVRTMMTRYRGVIRYWEVWNEPDLKGFNRMSLEEYVALQKAAFEEAVEAAPEAIVMTGGFATMSPHPGKKSPTFHRDYLKQAAGYFKIHAYHEHSSFQRYANSVDNLFLPMRAETGTSVPWYANETAVTSMNGSEKNQAIELFKKLLFAWARGAIGYNWYDLRNDGSDPAESEHNFGMITNDFYPKPVYVVYNTLAANFLKAGFVRQLEAPPGCWLFQFADAGDILIPAWNESQFGSSIVLAVRTDAQKAFIIDLMGNATEQPIIDGMTLVEAKPIPRILKLTGAARADMAGSLITVKDGGLALPGKTFKLAVSLRNPLGTEREFQLKLRGLPPEFSVKSPEQAVKVASGSESVAVFEIAVASGYKPSYGQEHVLNIDYRLAQTPWQGTLSVPVNSAIMIAREKREPDFTLNNRSQVVSLTAADPAMAHRIWKNADDLSARIYLSEAGGKFKLRAEVTDDIHHQPYSGASAWQGDNIQLAFLLPGQQGYWEIGLSRLNSGASEVYLFQSPQGFDAKKSAAAMTLKTTVEGKQLIYELEIPFQAVGMNQAALRSGIRFNLLINDNDGEGRDGWLHIAPGIGENKNPEKFPFIQFE